MTQFQKARAFTLFFLLTIFSTVSSFTESQAGSFKSKILVILNDAVVKSTHSIFLNSLSKRGYELEYKLATEKNIIFQKYGEYFYDAAVILAPQLEADSVDLASILEFVDSGHDLIFAGDEEASDFIKDLGTECGADFDEVSGNLVIDHIQKVVSEIDVHNTLIPVSPLVNSTAILGSEEYTGPILYRGVGLSVSPTSELVVPVLSASDSAFTGSPYGKVSKLPSMIGKAITLVAAMQARNNARVIISGSMEIFSDKFFRLNVEKDGQTVLAANRKFAEEISKWVLHERGHLKAGPLTHHKIGETEEPSIYRIGDKVAFSLDISEWTGKAWVPYEADDVQVQLYMMSPYVLKTLAHDGKGKFSTEIHVPDVYGVFQFKVEYKKLGFTTLTLTKQIPVRPFRHDEYDRFIPSAFPYYASTFSMMAGFFLFGFVFLYHK